MTASLLISCGGSTNSPTPVDSSVPPPPQPQQTSAKLVFKDVAAERGLEHKSEFSAGLDKDPRFFAGGGAAGDIDNDGDIDIFVTRGDTLPNLLFINDGNGNFSDQADRAGLALPNGGTANYKLSGPSLADLDGDGFLDLFIGGVDGDPSLLFINKGDGTFSDITAASGLMQMTSVNTISSAFGDYDQDGDLDLALAHWGTARNSSNPGTTETLWRNDSDSTDLKFTDVSQSSQLSDQLELNLSGVLGPNYDYTFSPNFADVNGDGWPDLLSVSDFNGSQIFINNQDGTFTDMTSRTEISEGNGMGSTVGDYDNDGDLDWFVSSINGNAVYNNDDGVFSRNRNAGVSGGGWGWGSCFADFDADGFLDIYQTNGWINNTGGNPNEPYTEDASRLWMSNGDKTFTRSDVEAEIIDTEQGRGVICADFDGDLDIDVLLLINNAEKGLFLFDNNIDTKNAISIDLQGMAPNTKAIGARITVTADGKTQTRELRIGSNFTAHDPTQQIIGVGDENTIELIRIVWPDGKVTEDNNVSANQALKYSHPDL